MATITQKSIFGWQEIEDLGDLSRLALVLTSIPDEPLMRKLEAQRRSGRDDYPIRPTWNAMLAGVVFQHPTSESLLRELSRNGQLRDICGFDPTLGSEAVPTSSAFSRFLSSVMDHVDLLQKIFDDLVEAIAKELPDYGQQLGIDGKAIASYAPREREGKTKKQAPGRRRDSDAKWGKHTYRGQREDGTTWKKVIRWFGYKLHLIVDTRYELPVAFTVTPAPSSEVVIGRELQKGVHADHPLIVDRCKSFSADRSYDDTTLIKQTYDDWAAYPVIDIRNTWAKDGEQSRLLEGRDNVVYDYRGNIFCFSPRGKREPRPMVYGGHERSRGTVKYRCPADHYGLDCEGRDRCRVGRSIRVPMAGNRRLFTPLPRNTGKWKRLYAARTATERVHARLDHCYGFENHTIRGLTKMRTRCTLALVVMLAMALGRIRQQRPEQIRSLLKPA